MKGEQAPKRINEKLSRGGGSGGRSVAESGAGYLREVERGIAGGREVTTIRTRSTGSGRVRARTNAHFRGSTAASGSELGRPAARVKFKSGFGASLAAEKPSRNGGPNSPGWPGIAAKAPVTIG